MSFNNDTEGYICLSESFSFLNNDVFIKHVVSQKFLSKRFAITSDSNTFFKMRKARHQKYSIVWKLSLILARAVPEPDTPDRAYKIYRSTSTIQVSRWSSPHDYRPFETTANTKRNPQGITEVTYCQGCLMLTLAGIFIQSLRITKVNPLINVLADC